MDGFGTLGKKRLVSLIRGRGRRSADDVCPSIRHFSSPLKGPSMGIGRIHCYQGRNGTVQQEQPKSQTHRIWRMGKSEGGGGENPVGNPRNPHHPPQKRPIQLNSRVNLDLERAKANKSAQQAMEGSAAEGHWPTRKLAPGGGSKNQNFGCRLGS